MDIIKGQVWKIPVCLHSSQIDVRYICFNISTHAGTTYQRTSLKCFRGTTKTDMTPALGQKLLEDKIKGFQEDVQLDEVKCEQTRTYVASITS